MHFAVSKVNKINVNHYNYVTNKCMKSLMIVSPNGKLYILLVNIYCTSIVSSQVVPRAGRYWNFLSRYIMAKSITVLLYITIFYFFSA